STERTKSHGSRTSGVSSSHEEKKATEAKANVLKQNLNIKRVTFLRITVAILVRLHILRTGAIEIDHIMPIGQAI
ncbi:MAG TPA: hypothetical protein PKC10_16175, partial [Cyclobacteriaceae bacterium]|nr:hypothetical protein [Cyclobacteriaceae bacterium]